MWTIKWVLSQRQAEEAGLRRESAVEKWSEEKKEREKAGSEEEEKVRGR